MPGRNISFFTLTKMKLEELRSRGYNLVCADPECRKDLEPGDDIVSKRRNHIGESTRVYFCRGCWERKYFVN